MIVFHVVRWKNLLSTGNVFTEVSLDSAPLTLLSGESGHGKSTLLDAITFALFNKPYRNINKAQLINSLNGSNLVVEIEFTVGGKLYKVCRGIKPNFFRIYSDGVLLNQDAASTDYQQYLEKNVLRMNFKTFRQIVVLGVADFVPFMQLSPKDRRTIIDELLDIEVFTTMKALLKTRMGEVKDSIVDVNYRIQSAETSIKMQVSHIESLQVDNNTLVQTKEEELKELEAEHAQLEKLVSEKRSEYEALKTSEPKGDVSVQLFELSNAETKAKQKITTLKKRIAFYQSHQSCPECEQQIDKEFIAQRVELFEQKIAEIDAILLSVEPKRNTLEAKQRQNREFTLKVAAAEKDLRDAETSLRYQNTTIARLKSDIASLSRPTKTTKDEKERLEEFKAQLKSLEKEKDNLLHEKNVQEMADELLKDSGVKSLIIKQYLPLINKYTNQFLSAMNFFVVFTIDEEFKEKIQSRGRDDFSYANFSEGEKQRIDLALLFAWRSIAKLKNSLATNLLVLDEVFDSYLNQEATENAIEMLRSDVLKGSNIFVTSHKETISDKFDSVLRFVYENNFSRIDD